MQFRVADIAYPFALFATSVGAFGFERGLLASLMVAIFWLAAYKQPRTTIIEWLVVVGIVVVLLGLLLPAFQEAREHTRVATCRHHLGDLAKALHLHPEKEGGLPQAIIQDERGAPAHSWRVSILPFIDDQSTYDAYDWSEPWSSSNNSIVAISTIEHFLCPSDPLANSNSPHANYFAIVSPQTAWPTDRGLQLSEVNDGLENTILLLEAASLGVTWTQPRDLTYDEAIKLLTGAMPKQLVHGRYDEPGCFYKQHSTESRGVHAAFADGTVRFLPVPLPEEMAKALLTANAGDEVDWDEFERLTAPQLDYAKIYATIAFAIVALWPARRALRKRPA